MVQWHGADCPGLADAGVRLSPAETRGAIRRLGWGGPRLPRMTDLADQISSAAFAALALARHDDRLERLSGIVLQGGAYRFYPVVRPGVPLDLVVPVGVPSDRVDYGALVLQAGSAGLVWRDSVGTTRTSSVTLDGHSRAWWAPLTLGGEQWVRIDVSDELAGFAVLLPPMATTDLRMELVRRLRAHHRPSGGHATAPLLPPEPAPVARPAVMFPAWTPDAQSGARPDAQPGAQPGGQPGSDDDTLRHAPVPGQGVPPVSFTPAMTPQSWNVQPAPAAHVAARSGMSATTQGFLIGLIGTLIVGGLALVLRAMLG